MKLERWAGAVFVLILSGCGKGENFPAACFENCPPADLAKIARHRQANKSLVAKTLEAIPVDTTVEVASKHREICKLPDSYQGSATRYSLAKKGDGLHMGLVVQLDLDDVSATDRKSAVEEVMACNGIIEKVWARYGITLSILHTANKDTGDASLDEYLLAVGKVVPKEFTHEMALHNDFGRADSGDLYLKGSAPVNCSRQCRSEQCKRNCEVHKANSFCTTTLHEYGHLEGFPDEYAEEDKCPDRTTVSNEESPWSVMNDHYKGTEVIDFFPRHLEALLKPLVDKAAADAEQKKKDEQKDLKKHKKKKPASKTA